MTLHFVELCCGSAAVSLRLLGGPRPMVPPTGYMGGKRRHAAAILDALGIRGHRPDRVTLCDAGPWARAWRTLAVSGRDVAAQLRREGGAGRALYDAVKARPVPVDDVEWTAAFLLLQDGSVGSVPVHEVGGVWKCRGYAELSPSAVARGFKVRLSAASLATRVDRLDLHGVVEIVDGDARDVDPVPGSVLYVDPDYQGTTGYTATLPRADLVVMARRWSDAGAAVAVSEAEPLELGGGWHHVALPDPGGWQARTFGKTQEWLTMNREPHRLPAEQGEMFDPMTT